MRTFTVLPPDTVTACHKASLDAFGTPPARPKNR